MPQSFLHASFCEPIQSGFKQTGKMTRDGPRKVLEDMQRHIVCACCFVWLRLACATQQQRDANGHWLALCSETTKPFALQLAPLCGRRQATLWWLQEVFKVGPNSFSSNLTRFCIKTDAIMENSNSGMCSFVQTLPKKHFALCPLAASMGRCLP
jgi:hypothetical protein